MNPTILIVLALVAVVAVALWWLKNKQPWKGPGRGSLDRVDGSMEKLVNRLRGDRAQAERLIAYEQGRSPSITRHQAILDAMERLERDRS